MRASTLFAVTIAILLGLAAAVAVKVTGYLNAPPAVAPARMPEINVLVASRNIFKGDLIDAPWVRVRPLRADELKEYELNKDKFLPPVPGATSLRMASKNLEADKPILKEDLEPMAKPESLSTRLLPSMRAVNVSVPKEQSAGGMIQVGEWVDVLFTTQINVDGAISTRTAAIAHKQRVIAKRNSPWNIFGHLPDEKPVNYTLEMNPYRASLVEYCKTRGVLSLLAVSSAEQKSLEERRSAALNDENFEQAAFAPHLLEESGEYAGEDDRIDAINRGEINIGTQDLVRIFGIQTKEPPDPKEKPITVERLSGNTRLDPAQFNRDGTVYEDPSARRRGVVAAVLQRTSSSQIDFSKPELQFQMPKEKGCQNCKKKKESANPEEE
jgi:Flp pilus assembly protein CpaB